ncbi:MAG: glycine-rich protein [Spirosomataceae bacterium]
MKKKLLLLLPLLSAALQSSFAQQTVSFTTDGSFTVPPGITSVEVVAKGTRGGNNGGGGGVVSATLSVTPGEILLIKIAAKSGYGFLGVTGGNFGGGATDIRTSEDISTRLIVAGGGGGKTVQGTGGAGGGLVGGDGTAPTGTDAGGKGGGQSAGGAGGIGTSFGNGGDGSLGQGGNANANGGGGGGGGYYGGGGGAYGNSSSGGAGGGGSSYTDPVRCTNVVHTQGGNNGAGSLTITYQTCAFTPTNIINTGNGIMGFIADAQCGGMTYTPDGTLNGAPKWKAAGNFPYRLVWTGTAWEFQETDSGNLTIARNATGSATNLPCGSTGWTDPNNLGYFDPGGMTISGGCGSLTAPTVTPSVSIASDDADNSITAGTGVTFTATPTNGGTTPSYQWKKNDSNVGSNSNQYTDAGLVNGDVITCIMTGNDVCASSATATSNTITMTVTNPCTLPTAYTVTGGGNYCDGGSGLSINLSNSETGVSYQLKNGITPVGNPVEGTGEAFSFGTQPAGDYTVTATRTQGGCSTDMTGNVTITAITPPTANAGLDKITCGTTAVALSAVTGVPNLTESGPKIGQVPPSPGQWSGGAGTFSNANSPTSTYTPIESEIGTIVTLTWTVAGTSPCANASDDMTVTVVPPPTANAGADKSTCGTTPVQLAAVGTGQWSGGAGTFSNVNSPTSTYTPIESEIGTVLNLIWTVAGNAPCPNASDDMTVTVKPNPEATLTASQTEVCPNTQVTLNAQCSIPNATVNWITGAPTVIPNAATSPYVYKASCSADGCTGNESSVEIRTHRILVDLKNVDTGTQPKALAGTVKDNLAPTNTITAATAPRLWTILAQGCAASESAVFKLSGPINFNNIDNNPPYAIFANVGPDYFAIDHPNYGAGSTGFPNGTYTLTVEMRSTDGVGGPFPKNRIATGALLATRTLQFTVSEGGQNGREGIAESHSSAENELNETQWLSMGQNPVSTEVVVRLSGRIGQQVELSLMNLQGQPVQQRTVVLHAVQQYEVLNVERAAEGLYLLKAVKDNQVKTLKVVKRQ